MGIKNFHTFMRKKIPVAYNKITLLDLHDKKLAIDTSIFVCKFKSSLGEKWLSGFLTMIHKLVDNNIHFIFCFDGQAPPEKTKERETRSITRQKVKNRLVSILEEWYDYYDNHRDSNQQDSEYCLDDFSNFQCLKSYLSKKVSNSKISEKEIVSLMYKLNKNLVPIGQDDYRLLKEMFDKMNVSYLTSTENQEAESLCVLLTKMKITDAILTEDTDAIAYGTPTMYFNVNFRNQTLEHLSLDLILSHLNITYEQLRDWCIMCGTDYNKNLKLVGPTKAFDLIKKHSCLENISNVMQTQELTFENVRRLFNCERFKNEYDDVIHQLNLNNTTIRLFDLETKKFLFFHNIQILY